MSRKRRTGLALLALAFVLSCLHLVPAQQNPAGSAKKFTVEQILAPAYPYELVSAARTDRIAWLAFERGMRNVYTAAGPDFEPVRLTSFMQDDGNDLTGLRISADGSLEISGQQAKNETDANDSANDKRGATVTRLRVG